MESNRAWYKKGWGIVVAILILPFFASWYVWTQTQWSKTIKIGVIIVILAGFWGLITVGEPMTQQGSPARNTDVEKEAVTNEPTNLELDAEVRFNELAFKIDNKEQRPWKDCEFEVNGGATSNGYVYRANVEALDSIIIPYSEFTKSDGTRFNISTTKAQNLSIYCTNVEGKTGYNYFTI